VVPGEKALFRQAQAMKPAEVSVIVPVWNGRALLEGCWPVCGGKLIPSLKS
jgi:hypothetical protein